MSYSRVDVDPFPHYCCRNHVYVDDGGDENDDVGEHATTYS